MTCLSQMVDGGGRQITSFPIPSDIPDLHSLYLDVLDYDIWAVTNGRLANMEYMQAEELREALEQQGAEVI